MFALPAVIAGVLLQTPAAALPSVRADWDGSGAPSLARIASSSRRVELEIAEPSGRVVARAPLAVSPDRAATVTLSPGALGSAGALLEVAYTGAPGTVCRHVFRFREGRLSRLPIQGPGGPLPDCGDAGWISRWDRPDPAAPSVWMRERSLATPEGVARDVEAYVFGGFELALSPANSRAEIRGVPIPAWPDVVYYPRDSLQETLFSRVNLAKLRSQPRVRVVASQAGHRFDVRVEKPSGEQVFPVCRATRRADQEVSLTGESDGQTLRILLTLGGTDEKVPIEAAVIGLGAPADGFYTPVIRRSADALRIYPSAEDEIAAEALSGDWSGSGRGSTSVFLVSGFPAVLRFGQKDVSLSIARAPDGVDVVLVPGDGSPPDAGLRLLGPDRIVRVPLACDSSGACRVAGDPEPLRRAGARMN